MSSYPNVASSAYPSQQLNLDVENLPSRGLQGYRGHSASVLLPQITNSSLRQVTPTLRFPHPSKFRNSTPTCRCPPSLWPSRAEESMATPDITCSHHHYHYHYHTSNKPETKSVIIEAETDPKGRLNYDPESILPEPRRTVEFDLKAEPSTSYHNRRRPSPPSNPTTRTSHNTGPHASAHTLRITRITPRNIHRQQHTHSLPQH